MANTTTAKNASISIKVMVDKVKKRVVYAEADHTFVDILFSFVTLPLGTIIRLLRKLDDHNTFEAFGSLNNLYQSLKDFPECYFTTEECKSMLLNPRNLSYDHCRNLKLKIDDTEPLKCAAFGGSSTKFNSFEKVMYQEIGFSKSDVCVGGGLFVSDIAKFIVTDDLCVMPYTFESSVQLLTDLGITNQSCLEETKLDMDSEQLLCLLKTAVSLDSYVLTRLVFQHTNLIRGLVAGQCSTFDETLTKKDESSSSKILLRSGSTILEALSETTRTVVGELIKGSFLTCMNNILKSISDLSVGRYLLSQDIKNMLLKSHIGQQFSSKNQLFPLKGTNVYVPKSQLKGPMKDGQPLKQSGMFMVTDDLIITPSSSVSILKTLNDLNVPFDDIEKCEVCVGLAEG